MASLAIEPTRRNAAAAPDRRFRVLHELGTGGMGTVYAADDLTRMHRVALKFARSSDEGRAAAIRRLHREGSALARLRHAHVCAGWGVMRHAGQSCLVLEYLEGETLREHARGRTLSTREVLQIVDAVAAALIAVHKAGLVHGDIKPTNVFVTSRGVIKLLDFGLAVPIGGGFLSPATAGDVAHDALYGTANYMAPERILRRPQTGQSDLFALGAVMYELLTGRPPHAGASTAETVFNVLDQEATAVSVAAQGRGRALDGILARLLAKQPAKRFRSAEAVRLALRGVRAQLGQRGMVPHVGSRATSMARHSNSSRFSATPDGGSLQEVYS